jgi:putative oxidoreductase
MLASIFVAQGWQQFQNPERVSPLAEPVVQPLRERIPAVPAETEHAVRINGAVQATAGTMLGLGVLPRIAALAIAGTLVPTTLAGHRFWEIEDPQERAAQRIHFLKNLTMMGGLLLAIADKNGNPSLSWRRHHAARVANGYLAAMTQAVTGAAEEFADAAHAAAAPRKRG